MKEKPLKATELENKTELTKKKGDKVTGEKKSIFSGFKSMFDFSSKNKKVKTEGKGEKKVVTKKLTSAEKLKQAEQKQYIEAEKIQDASCEL